MADFKQLNGKSIEEAFRDFDKDNPAVWVTFKDQAIRAILSGKKKLSSKAIINWMRWEIFIKTTDENFKINDAFTSHYARKFHRAYPQYDGIFETRKLRSAEPGPYMDVDQDGQFKFF